MQRVTADGRHWVATPQAGVEVCVLCSREDMREVAALLSMRAGARLPRHGHPGGEHIYVVRGCVRVNEERVRAGDYHYTLIGETHEVVAQEQCLLLSVLPKGLDAPGHPRAPGTA